MRIDEFLKSPIVISDVHRLAMEVICIVKYGSIGGTATASELKAVEAHLRKYVPKPKPKVTLAPPKPKVTLAPPKPKVTLAPPTIRIKVTK